MIDLVAGEFLKLRTTRTFWWVSGLAAGLPVLITVLSLAFDSHTTPADARNLLSGAGIAGLFMIILGVVGAAGEYRHRTITSTFLAAPDRSRVIAAKGIAHAIAGLCVGVVCMGLVLAISMVWLTDPSLSSLLDGGDIARIAVGSIAYVAISGALGVGVGALLTNQTAGVVGLLIFSFVLDPVIAGLVSGYGKFSLQGLGQTLSGSPSGDIGYDIFPLGVAVAVYLGYAIGALVVAAVVTSRRDVG